MDITKTTSRTTTSQVYQNLRDYILQGRLLPGNWLREQDLVEQFEVSRTPIREALRRLESVGLVELIPYRGARVISPDVEEIREEYIVRAALEGMAVELAVPAITKDILAQLQEKAARIEMLLDEGNFQKFLEVNRSFHMTLYAQSNTRQLLTMIQASWDRDNLYRQMFFFRWPEGLNMEKEIHRDLLLACANGDSVEARNVMQQSCFETAAKIAQWSSNE